MPVIIDITPGLESGEIEKKARILNDLKVKRGVRSKKVAKGKTDLEIHIEGIKGEYAIAHFLKTQFIMKPDLESDAGHDFFVGDTPGQAKWTNTVGGGLFFDPWAGYPFKSDVAFLATPPFETGAINKVMIAGWITKTRFKLKKTIKNYGYGDRIAVVQSELFPVEWHLRDRIIWQIKRLSNGESKRPN